MLVPIFLAGWLVSELAFYVVAVQIVVTILFMQAGAVSGFWGVVAFLLNIAAGYSFIRHYLNGNNTSKSFEIAFHKEFGEDFEEAIPQEELKKIPQSVSIERLLKPFSLDLPEVERLNDIEYDASNGVKLCLDIYRKRGDTHDESSKKPVLFQIHGGAWMQKLGSRKEQARPLMNHMAKHGWISVSISYRLSPRATFPAHIIDCKKALAWVKQNIAEYGGDPDYIVATGGSAGGHLSSLLALTANDEKFQPGFENIDTSVQGCVPFYGVYDFTNANKLRANDGLQELLQKYVFKKSIVDFEEEFKEASPIHRLHKDAPPFLVIQGDSDNVVSFPEAPVFANELSRVSNESVCYVELQGAQHAFDIFISLRSEQCKHAVHKYLSYMYAKHRTN